MKDGDFIEHLFVCSSHDYLLFFSNRGKVYRSKVYELPEASRTAKGRALVNVLPLREGERIQSVLSTRDFTETQVPRVRDAQRHGQEDRAAGLQHADQGRRHHRDQHPRRRRAARRARASTRTTRSSWSRSAGLTVRFAESDARAMGRDTTGVRGMDVGKDGEVIAMDVARDDMDLLVVTENGYGKRTQIDQYRKTNRGAKGVKTIELTESKGALAGALVVREHQELVFISSGRHGPAHRARAGSPARPLGPGRARDEPQGRRLVSAVALVVESEADDRRDRCEDEGDRARRRGRTTSVGARRRSWTTTAWTTTASRDATRYLDPLGSSSRRLLLSASPEKGGGPYRQFEFLRDPGGGRPLDRRLAPASESTPGHPRRVMPGWSHRPHRTVARGPQIQSML